MPRKRDVTDPPKTPAKKPAAKKPAAKPAPKRSQPSANLQNVPTPKRPRGQQSSYTPELAEMILQRLAAGDSLLAICRDPGMPSDASVRRWVMDDVQGFASEYTRARQIGWEHQADKLLEIADEPCYTTRTITRKDGSTEVIEVDNVERARLRADSRKWLLSKCLPKVYGDKLELSGQVDMPLDQVQAKIAALVAKAKGQDGPA